MFYRAIMALVVEKALKVLTAGGAFILSEGRNYKENERKMTNFI